MKHHYATYYCAKCDHRWREVRRHDSAICSLCMASVPEEDQATRRRHEAKQAQDASKLANWNRWAK